LPRPLADTTIVNEGSINGKFATKSIAGAGFIEIWALEPGSAVYLLQTREFPPAQAAFPLRDEL